MIRAYKNIFEVLNDKISMTRLREGNEFNDYYEAAKSAQWDLSEKIYLLSLDMTEKTRESNPIDKEGKPL